MFSEDCSSDKMKYSIEQALKDRNKWREIALRDALTKLPNRLAIEGLDGGWWIACDLDGFKAAQDQHPDGHTYGDRVLVEFADKLREIIRFGTDIILSRVGGDEFLVWCPNLVGARRIAFELCQWWNKDKTVSVTVGIGETIEKADKELYKGK